MKRFFLFLVAVSILNQSIDTDYCINGRVAWSSYDDIDSVYELLVENVTGDPGYTAEDDSDDGYPKSSQAQNEISSWLYCQEIKITSPVVPVDPTTVVGLNSSLMISKGYRFIVSPPPDPAFFV